MAKFMLLLGGADLDKRSGGKGYDAIFQRYMGWVKELTDAGKLAASYKLFDQTGARLSMRAGDIVDGPFVETKESIGGLFVIEASSLDEAKKLARECPVLRLQNGFVEVRGVER
jgi:hypothetical protein